jgi:hypothetical protein
VVSFLLAVFAALRAFFRNLWDVALEVLALRQQVAVLKRRRPRPPLNALDRLFWTVLQQTWARWRDVPHRETGNGHRLPLVPFDPGPGWHKPHVAAVCP